MISPRAIEVGARALCAEQFGDEVIHGEARCCQLGGIGGCCVDELARQMKAVLTALAAEGMVVVPQSALDELRRRNDTISKIGPRGDPLAETCIRNECLDAWPIVVAMINAAQPAEGEK